MGKAVLRDTSGGEKASLFEGSEVHNKVSNAGSATSLGSIFTRLVEDSIRKVLNRELRVSAVRHPRLGGHDEVGWSSWDWQTRSLKHFSTSNFPFEKKISRC